MGFDDVHADGAVGIVTRVAEKLEFLRRATS
jgi:hypothetical protein